jgi:hypothetical protein
MSRLVKLQRKKTFTISMAPAKKRKLAYMQNLHNWTTKKKKKTSLDTSDNRPEKENVHLLVELTEI